VHERLPNKRNYLASETTICCPLDNMM